MRKNEKTTEDLFLGGRLKILQPLNGYRAAIDPVLLAAATCGDADSVQVLDVGIGVGVAALCLASRNPECQVFGIEIQNDLVSLAHKNIEMNGYEKRITVVEGDILNPPLLLQQKTFDAVMTNPPYYEADKNKASPDAQKAIANIESVDLKEWIDFCVQALKPKGTFTLIHRADRMDEILSYLYPHLGELIVFPLWPAQGKSAKRVIIRGRKGIKSGVNFSQGLVLHTAQGQFTPEAENILRFGKPLLLA